jgi:hypothetical protein
MMRCCPYCYRPVSWRYYGSVTDGAVDLKTERPHCKTHGPLPLWVVVDSAYPFRPDPTVPELTVPSPAIVAIATVDDLPYIVRDGRRLARILPRFLREPILLADARPMSVRWKLTPDTRQLSRQQPKLVPIELSVLHRLEWKRAA